MYQQSTLVAILYGCLPWCSDRIVSIIPVIRRGLIEDMCTVLKTGRWYSDAVLIFNTEDHVNQFRESRFRSITDPSSTNAWRTFLLRRTNLQSCSLKLVSPYDDASVHMELRSPEHMSLLIARGFI